MIVKYLLCSAALISALPAHSEVLNANKQGFQISNTVTIAATQEQVWQGLIKDVDLWWPKDHTWWGKETRLTIDAKAGGCFCETFENNSAEHMRISYVVPQQTLRMLGGLGPLQGMGVYGALTFQLSDVGDSEGAFTQIKMDYSVVGMQPNGFEGFAPVVDRVQLQQISALKTYLEK